LVPFAFLEIRDRIKLTSKAIQMGEFLAARGRDHRAQSRKRPFTCEAIRWNLMNSDTDQPKIRRGVLLTANLLFSTMVTGTASAVGQEVAVAADLAEAVELCHARPTAYVIIDLGMTEIEIETAVIQLRGAAGAVPIVAFGSHVDKALLDKARAAGCDEVLPRSRFSSELPSLLRRIFAGNRPG
jgi:CheY-like chemotaxis protein